jgi:hypothetical protein
MAHANLVRRNFLCDEKVFVVFVVVATGVGSNGVVLGI